MKNKNVRVIVASERPEVQYFLRGLVEDRGKVVTVGQAQNAPEALTLARNLRPDVAIIDCYLPCVVGLDTIPLSRTGGLDIAQTISEEIPNTRVILLNNLDTGIVPDGTLTSETGAAYSIVSQGADVPLTSEDLSDKLVQPNALVFANIEVKPEAPFRRKHASLSEKTIFFGCLGIAGGWLLTITMVLAPVGVTLASVGAAAVLFGLAVKLTASLRRRLFKEDPATRS